MEIALVTFQKIGKEILMEKEEAAKFAMNYDDVKMKVTSLEEAKQQ